MSLKAGDINFGVTEFLEINSKYHVSVNTIITLLYELNLVFLRFAEPIWKSLLPFKRCTSFMISTPKEIAQNGQQSSPGSTDLHNDKYVFLCYPIFFPAQFSIWRFRCDSTVSTVDCIRSVEKDKHSLVCT